jgi:D-3-phosphoglycerate dehydrogenase
VIESKSSRAADFASAITTRVSGCLERLVAGAIFHGGQPRIVRVDDFMLEAIPEGPTLLLHNHDRPGVVGHVGMVLGKAGVNISRMQLALHPKSGRALQLLNVNSTPGDDVLTALRALEGIESVNVLDLGAALE